MHVDPASALLLEALLSMMLVLVVYAAAVDDKTKAGPGVAPLLIGLTVSAAHLVCITYTGYIHFYQFLGGCMTGILSSQEQVSTLPGVLEPQYLVQSIHLRIFKDMKLMSSKTIGYFG